MKTIDEVERLVARRIDRHWAESILSEAEGHDDTRWPWTVALTRLTSQALHERWSDVWRWIIEWTTWADTNHCPLTLTTRRIAGANRDIPTRVSIPHIDIAASIARGDWTPRLTEARRRAHILVSRFPATITAGRLRRANLLSPVDFELAIAAADWFRNNDASGLTARQVPIAGLHAKWLDGQRALVTGLAGRDDLGLVTRPSRIHFSYRDPEWLRAGHRCRDSIALDEPHQQPGYTPDIVLIAENKDSALFFPELARTITIEGDGNAVTRLAHVPWIKACPNVVYWGDIDAHGFHILDRLRASGINAQTMLMDRITLERFAMFASSTYADGSPLPQTFPPPTPHLSPLERALLEQITDPDTDGPRRLEQERIPLQMAHDALLHAVAGSRRQ